MDKERGDFRLVLQVNIMHISAIYQYQVCVYCLDSIICWSSVRKIYINVMLGNIVNISFLYIWPLNLCCQSSCVTSAQFRRILL